MFGLERKFGFFIKRSIDNFMMEFIIILWDKVYRDLGL